MQLAFDLVLMVLLGATLFQSVRLERALGVLKRDRAALEELAGGFNTSTRQAEQGIERLRTAADGAGRQIARQIDTAAALKDDLSFLSERGGRLADRLDTLVREARGLAPAPTPARQFALAGPEPGADPDADAPPSRLRSQAERDLFKALRLAR